MAFHTSCPVSCEPVCWCPYGTPTSLLDESSSEIFLQKAADLWKLFQTPTACLVTEPTVEVWVPKISEEGKNRSSAFSPSGVDDDDAMERGRLNSDAADLQTSDADIFGVSLPISRSRLSKGKSIASLKAQEESEAMAAIASDPNLILCEICKKGEPNKSARAARMIPCKSCGRKFHTNCLRSWASFRDAFDWSNWTCSNCEACEICKKPGETHTSMHCFDCEKHHHCYCVQPALKAPPKGPYLCPDHTKCHCCSTRAPGTGISSKWFLNYTLCDSCGRLFVKNKYCPICLKVYRDSEPAPMVCCDDCEKWVHVKCDNITDELYERYQLDNGLPYKCPACTGRIHKVRDMADAAKQLWKRRLARVKEERKLEDRKPAQKTAPPAETDGEEEEAEEVEEKEAVAVEPPERVKKGKGGKKAKAKAEEEQSKEEKVPQEGAEPVKVPKKGRGKKADRAAKAAMAESLAAVSGAQEEEVKEEREEESKAEVEARVPFKKRKLTIVHRKDGDKKGGSGAGRVGRRPKPKVEEDEESEDVPLARLLLKKDGTPHKKKGRKPRVEPPAKAVEEIAVAAAEEEEEAEELEEGEIPADSPPQADTTVRRARSRGAVSEEAEADPAPRKKGMTLKLKLRRAEPAESEDGVPAGRELRRRAEAAEQAGKLVKGQRSKRGREAAAMDAGSEAVERGGLKAVNKRVEVYWPKDEAWYSGVLLDVEVERRKFVVLYDDGQQELLRFGKHQVRFAPASKK